MKKVSAIIVNWNGKDVLSVCLKSLLEQDYENLEIFVVDNGSDDGSQTLVKEVAGSRPRKCTDHTIVWQHAGDP